MERYPNLKEEVGGSIPGHEISSLLDNIHVRWSTTSCALTAAYRPSISRKKKVKKRLGANFKMNRLNLKKNRFQFKALGQLPVHLEEFINYSSI